MDMRTTSCGCCGCSCAICCGFLWVRGFVYTSCCIWIGDLDCRRCKAVRKRLLLRVFFVLKGSQRLGRATLSVRTSPVRAILGGLSDACIVAPLSAGVGRRRCFACGANDRLQSFGLTVRNTPRSYRLGKAGVLRGDGRCAGERRLELLATSGAQESAPTALLQFSNSRTQKAV